MSNISATNLGQGCSTNEECTLGNGGAGGICSTNCVCDTASGYTQTGTTCTKSKFFACSDSLCAIQHVFSHVVTRASWVAPVLFSGVTHR